MQPEDYLKSYTGPAYDYAVLSHCIWYFETPSVLGSIISALSAHCKNLCIAEWSLRSMKINSQAHVLTALLFSLMEAKRDVPGDGNIRTILSPTKICEVVEAASSSALGSKLKLEKQDIKESNEDLLDGHWEVSYLLRTREKILRKLSGEKSVNPKELMAFSSIIDAVQSNVDGLEGGVKGVKSMDVWMAKFSHSI